MAQHVMAKVRANFVLNEDFTVNTLCDKLTKGQFYFVCLSVWTVWCTRNQAYSKNITITNQMIVADYKSRTIAHLRTLRLGYKLKGRDSEFIQTYLDDNDLVNMAQDNLQIHC